MAMLGTPSHKCEQRYVDDKGFPRGLLCPRSAYKRFGGKWLCVVHTRSAKARAAREAQPVITFEVVGTW